VRDVISSHAESCQHGIHKILSNASCLLLLLLLLCWLHQPSCCCCSCRWLRPARLCCCQEAPRCSRADIRHWPYSCSLLLLLLRNPAPHCWQFLGLTLHWLLHLLLLLLLAVC
jgi:hypothetical protein